MKQRLKKWNRGLVLGALLLVGFVVFAIVKEAQFQNSVPEIKELSKSYAEALLRLNEMPDGALDEEFCLTSAAAEQKTAELEHLFQKYWNTETKQKTQNMSYNDLRERYLERLNGTQYSRVYEVDCNILEKDISVKNDGPNRATVTLYTDGLFATLSGTELACLFIDNVWTQAELEEMFEAYNPLESEGETRKKANFTARIELELELVKGEWKIISCSGTYWNNASTIVVDEVIVGGVVGE